MESLNRNLSIFESQDTCGTNGEPFFNERNLDIPEGIRFHISRITSETSQSELEFKVKILDNFIRSSISVFSGYELFDDYVYNEIVILIQTGVIESRGTLENIDFPDYVLRDIFQKSLVLFSIEHPSEYRNFYNQDTHEVIFGDITINIFPLLPELKGVVKGTLEVESSGYNNNHGVYLIEFTAEEKQEIIEFYERNKTILIQILGQESYDTAIESINNNNTVYSANYSTRIYPYYVRGALSGDLPYVVQSFAQAENQLNAGHLVAMEVENNLWTIDRNLIMKSENGNDLLLYVTPETKSVIESIAKSFQLRSKVLYPNGVHALLVLSSLLRPNDYNIDIGGSGEHSAHTRGIGVDFKHHTFDIITDGEINRITDLADIEGATVDIGGVRSLQNILYGVLREHDDKGDIIFTREGSHSHITVTKERIGLNQILQTEGIPKSTQILIGDLLSKYSIDVSEVETTLIHENMSQMIQFLLYIESHGGKNVENLLSSAKSPFQWLDGFKDGKPTYISVTNSEGIISRVRAFDRSEQRYSPFDTALRRNMRFYAEQSPHYDFELGDYYNYSKYKEYIPTWVIEFYEGQPNLSPLDLSNEQAINLWIVEMFCNERHDMTMYLQKIVVEGNQIAMIHLYSYIHHAMAVGHKATRDNVTQAAIDFFGIPESTVIFSPRPVPRGDISKENMDFTLLSID